MPVVRTWFVHSIQYLLITTWFWKHNNTIIIYYIILYAAVPNLGSMDPWVVHGRLQGVPQDCKICVIVDRK